LASLFLEHSVYPVAFVTAIRNERIIMTLNNFKSHIRNELRPETDVKSSDLVVSNLVVILPCLDMAKAYA